MQNLYIVPNDSQIGPDALAATARTRANRSSPRKRTRTRTHIACDTCRSRRTKCDSQGPPCSYCRTHGLECHYQKTPETPSRVELELAAINQRLDHLTNLISLTSSTHYTPHHAREDQPRNRNEAEDDFTDQESAPFRLIGTDAMMRVLGLEEGFADELVKLERSVDSNVGTVSRLIVQHQQAISALAAFSERIHCWYPIFRPGFSEHYLRIISGPLIPSPDSCLVLLVAAVGLRAQENTVNNSLPNRHDSRYFEAAMPSLPAVLSDCSVTGAQCLVLLAIYYCCLLKPCQAHDYTLIASFKVQSLLKSFQRTIDGNHEMYEHVKRAFWSILLLESELAVQFNVAQSGIWDLDDHIALPDHRRTWRFDVDAGSPVAASATSPASVLSSTSATTDKVQSYFLAEISMRRMLHRCNTAIKRLPSGKLVYAPGVAMELESQLDEWYSFLPEMIQFSTHNIEDPLITAINTPGSAATIPTPPLCPLTNFLRVQYHCCKISIYWPAVYQVMQDEHHTVLADSRLLEHCARLFDSYVQVIPSCITAYENCIVNRWTLYATIFMTSMAVLRVRNTVALRNLGRDGRVERCLTMAGDVDVDLGDDQGGSYSLRLLRDALRKRLRDASIL